MRSVAQRASSQWQGQALRYILVAGTTSVGYLAIVGAGIALGLQYMVAICVAQVVAISGAFPVYRRFVFVSRGQLRGDFLRFLAVWSAGAVAGLLFTPLLVEFGGAPPFPAHVGVLGAVAIGSFLSHRYFTFGTKSRS